VTTSTRVAKRTIDVLGSSVGLVVLGVPMAALAAIGWARQGGPILFRQRRIGRDGEPFVILKYRTMAEPSTYSSSDEERLTPFGRAMRRWSLDELPELLNVLRGDMSLVGPRPLLPQYVDRYTPYQMRRHEVRPGITGWAQVNGRNATTWQERFELDVWYVDNVSIALDLRILRRTLAQVVRGAGVSAEGHATMPEFMGDDGRDR
jgi:lipopolysaccharide/colanic/teichoic acid biosynthesis glycosyltransferase